MGKSAFTSSQPIVQPTFRLEQQMRKQKLLLLFIWVVTQLTACASPNSATTPAQASTMTSPTTIQKGITPTTPLTTIPPTTAQDSACWKMSSHPFPEITLPEKLVIYSYDTGLSVLDFKQHARREISNQDGSISYATTSPNGEWLSYTYFPPEGQKLIIETADGVVEAQTSVKPSWLMYSGVPWLDNQRLWFPDLGTEQRIPPTVIINPFTGQQQELLSDYPGLKRSMVGSIYTPGFHFVYTSVIYHPSLQLVIYPETATEQRNITLWNRQTQKILAKIPITTLYGNPPPMWMPDEKSFLVFAESNAGEPKEWHMVSQDGTVRQLTHLHDLYHNLEIGFDASISPDGKYLAFELSQGESSSNEAKQLMILNLKTLEVINPCISVFFGVSAAVPRPFWSPDSQYVAVLDSMNKATPITILSIEDKWAVNLAEGPMAWPVGWLKP